MAGRKDKSRLTPVADVLKTVLTGIAEPEDLALKDRVFALWEEVTGVGPDQARPFRFRGSTLLVEVSASVWITELSLRKGEIISHLERAVGSGIVEDIRFQIRKKREE